MSGSDLIGIPRKTKAAMIWKKGWKGWKKLQSFGNSSNNSKIIGESNRFGFSFFFYDKNYTYIVDRIVVRVST